MKMGVASKAGDLVFKAFTAGLGVATIYLTATFSVHVYRGLAWHNAQSVTTHSLSRFLQNNLPITNPSFYSSIDNYHSFFLYNKP